MNMLQIKAKYFKFVNTLTRFKEKCKYAHCARTEENTRASHAGAKVCAPTHRQHPYSLLFTLYSLLFTLYSLLTERMG
jgi:hypothetical protein